MNIAIDFDKTYDVDPDLWLAFMATSKVLGHNPFIVTIRNKELDRNPLIDDIIEKGYKVYYTDGLPKRETILAAFGQKVDVWIDDRPETILFGSHITVPALDKWRKENEIALMKEHGPLVAQQSE